MQQQPINGTACTHPYVTAEIGSKSAPAHFWLAQHAWAQASDVGVCVCTRSFPPTSKLFPNFSGEHTSIVFEGGEAAFQYCSSQQASPQQPYEASQDEQSPRAAEATERARKIAFFIEERMMCFYFFMRLLCGLHLNLSAITTTTVRAVI